ncbi:MAG TPA: hypothetical protein VGN16_12280 [Acidobacteriaceae bacterium]
MSPAIHDSKVTVTYPVWMEGAFEGVPVVAFDYRFDEGTNRKLGSGVGMQQIVMGAEDLASGMESIQHEGWTFLYTQTKSIRRNDRMGPEEWKACGNGCCGYETI